VPAHRSRTLEWRRCLQQIQERNGAIDIAVARLSASADGVDAEPPVGRDLVWRVRVLGLSDGLLRVEHPQALGHLVPLRPGVELVAVICIGQNRWMFHTVVVGLLEHRLNERKMVPAMALEMPDSVERCQRRNYYRVETVGLSLPRVDSWPLFDPASVVLAERLNEMQAERGRTRADLDEPVQLEFDDVMPDVGPCFTAMLMNIGGGGAGLLIEPGDVQTIARHRLLWLRISLPPELSDPICVTGKVVHTHVESSQHVYAGVSFDFTFNAPHERFVVDQICRYVTAQQREQLQRAQSLKKSA
jgi:c-di-GMP-binding flagellar brake protein YcgR